MLDDFRKPSCIGHHHGQATGRCLDHRDAEALAIIPAQRHEHIEFAQFVRYLHVWDRSNELNTVSDAQFPCEALQFLFLRASAHDA